MTTVWDLEREKAVTGGPSQDIDFTDDQQTMLVSWTTAAPGRKRGVPHVDIWNLASLERVIRLDDERDEEIGGTTFVSRRGKTGELVLRSLKDGKPLASLGLAREQGDIGSYQLFLDGDKYVHFQTATGTYRWWDATNGHLIDEIPGAEGTRFAVCPDGEHLMRAGATRPGATEWTVSTYRLADGKRSPTTVKDPSGVTGGALSSDWGRAFEYEGVGPYKIFYPGSGNAGEGTSRLCASSTAAPGRWWCPGPNHLPFSSRWSQEAPGRPESC